MRKHRWKSTSYGRSGRSSFATSAHSGGGEGPNTGKKKAIYRATAPDGSLVEHAGFFFDPAPNTAFIYMVETGGKWEGSGVREDHAWGVMKNSRWVAAERVK